MLCEVTLYELCYTTAYRVGTLLLVFVPLFGGRKEYIMIKTRKNFFGIIYGIMVAVLIFMISVPAFASDRNNSFSFSFDGMGSRTTSTQWKDTTHAVTMKCTGTDNLSSYAYYAKVCSSNGDCTGYKKFVDGTFQAYYSASDYNDSGVYFSAYLGGDDTDCYWGYWNPDDSNY